ncbi:MAG: helix-turn-helix domain-containing protein [Candidatus Nitricoxidivorans perseverans]|uniref:Helix-turn-helix domain-containing protein n=1 Tax=Candidatus Nitricoxidivorans perseverans TaxID=2975601 RepID=A0AA49J1C0_9PROT|nr:MAG: helix-turn-helix domain-containing protein [Candidatus Nitricoxidivorans perseverans]
METLLKHKEAAAALAVSPSWLAMARSRGDGPAYLRIGKGRGVIRYSREALEQFVADMAKKKG